MVRGVAARDLAASLEQRAALAEVARLEIFFVSPGLALGKSYVSQPCGVGRAIQQALALP